MGNADRNAPLQPFGAQQAINFTIGAAVHRHRNMRAQQVIVQVQLAAGWQRTAVQQARKRFFKQHFTGDVCCQVGEHAQCQINLALGDLFKHAVTAVLSDHQRGVGRLDAQLAQQFGQHNRGTVVRHGQTESAMGVGRHKVDRLAEQDFDLAEDLLERCLKVLRQGTQHHFAALTNQDRIVEQDPQLAQRVADGRLAQMQSGAGTGHVFFSQQRVEHHQQVQINIAQ